MAAAEISQLSEMHCEYCLTDICSTPVDVTLMEVEGIFKGGGGEDHVAGGRVHHALRLSR